MSSNRNIRQITALRDTYTNSRALRSLFDAYSGCELVDGRAFQPIKSFYPREVIERNCFRETRGEETATHIFDPTIAEGPRFRMPNAGETATHVNEWEFPMFPDFALYRRSYNIEEPTETESDDRFDGDEETIGQRMYDGLGTLSEERFRTTLFDEGSTGGEVEIFWAFYRDVVQRVGWFVYPPAHTIRRIMVNGRPQNVFLTEGAWYGRFISELSIQPEEVSQSTVNVTATIEISQDPYNTISDPNLRFQTAGRIEDVYPGGYGRGS